MGRSALRSFMRSHAVPTGLITQLLLAQSHRHFSSPPPNRERAPSPRLWCLDRSLDPAHEVERNVVLRLYQTGGFGQQMPEAHGSIARNVALPLALSLAVQSTTYLFRVPGSLSPIKRALLQQRCRPKPRHPYSLCLTSLSLTQKRRCYRANTLGG